MAQYTPEVMATLLPPAGITSEASIYKDESKLLDAAKDVDKVYIEEILPEKMRYKLKNIENFNFWHDIKFMFMTITAVLGKTEKSGRMLRSVE